MSSYATVTDLTTYGLPANALGQLSVPMQQAQLDNASKKVDTYLRGRYPLPLLTWGTEITEAVCVLAAYSVLAVRGFNPAAGADVVLRDRYLDTVNWLVRVQKQQAHPDVTTTPSANAAPEYNQPTVISSSVSNLDTGATKQNRGW